MHSFVPYGMVLCLICVPALMLRCCGSCLLLFPAHYLSTCRALVRENISSARVKVKSDVDNIAGVKLPTFVPEVGSADANELTGLAQGGAAIQTCKAQWEKYCLFFLRFCYSHIIYFYLSGF